MQQSIIFESFEDAIRNIPYFEINFIDKPIYHFLKKDDKFHHVPEIYEDDVKSLEGNDLANLKKQCLLNIKNCSIYRSGKVIYTPQSVEDGYIQCFYCGRIWDGCAQCDCYNIDL